MFQLSPIAMWDNENKIEVSQRKVIFLGLDIASKFRELDLITQKGWRAIDPQIMRIKNGAELRRYTGLNSLEQMLLFPDKSKVQEMLINGVELLDKNGLDGKEIIGKIYLDVLGPRNSRIITIPQRCLSWDNSRILQLAQQINSQSNFDQMSLLATMFQDAFEETKELPHAILEPAILEHCSEGVQHYPGCWLVDDILGLK